jgi:site-specific DNA-methyltransferase (adenine-specific)
LNPENVALTKKIFKMIDPDSTLNIVKGDFLEGKYKYKADIIIGNPPYNESDTNAPLYTKFIIKALSELPEKTGKLLFLVPSRWFTSVKGLNDFREFMLKREDIVFINHIPNSQTIFRKVDIAGGINYFLIDKEYSGPTTFIDTNTNTKTKLNLNKFDILVPNTSAYPIINKILDKPKLSDLYLSTKYFGINTNSVHFLSVNNKTNPDLVKCYVSKRKGSIKYVDKKHIINPYHFWKVFITQGNGKVNDGFINFIIGSPSEIASQSYFAFKVQSKAQAESLISYLETDVANFMLWLRKIDHHINKDTLSWIPLPPLNRKWTNASIEKYYKLTNSEIKTIRREKNNNKRPIAEKKNKTKKINNISRQNKTRRHH